VAQQVISVCLGQLRRIMNSCGYGECQSTAPLGGWGTRIFACTLKCALAGFGESIQRCPASVSCSWLFSGSVVRGVGDTVKTLTFWFGLSCTLLGLFSWVLLSPARLFPYIQHHYCPLWHVMPSAEADRRLWLWSYTTATASFNFSEPVR